MNKKDNIYDILQKGATTEYIQAILFTVDGSKLKNLHYSSQTDFVFLRNLNSKIC